MSRLLGLVPRQCLGRVPGWGDYGAHQGICTEALRFKADAQLWIRDGEPVLATMHPQAEEVTPERWQDLVETLKDFNLQARRIKNGSWISKEAVLIEVFPE